MKRSGFALIEFLILIAIGGILFAIIFPHIQGDKKVTCFSGEKIIYEGYGVSTTMTSGCFVKAQDGSEYRCTACAERKY